MAIGHTEITRLRQTGD